MHTPRPQVFTDVDINLAPSAQQQAAAANGGTATGAAEGSSASTNGTGPAASEADSSRAPSPAPEAAANGSSAAASDPEDWSNPQMLALVGAMKKHGKVLRHIMLRAATPAGSCRLHADSYMGVAGCGHQMAP